MPAAPDCVGLRVVGALVDTGPSTSFETMRWRKSPASGPATRMKSRGSPTTPTCRLSSGGEDGSDEEVSVEVDTGGLPS